MNFGYTMNSCRIKAKRVISSAPLKFASSFFILKWKKKIKCILQICCCQEVPSVKQKVIAGNPFVDRPLRLLQRSWLHRILVLLKTPMLRMAGILASCWQQWNPLSWCSWKAALVRGNVVCLMVGEDSLPFRQMGLIWLPLLPKLQKPGWGKPCELN